MALITQHRATFFKLAEQVLAIDGSVTRQIVTVLRVTLVPRSSDHLLGLFSTGGMIVPLLNLHSMLGLRPLADRQRDLAILLEVDGETFAFSIDEMLGFFACEPTENSLGDDLQGFATKEVKGENLQAALLDVTKLAKTFMANLAVL